LTDKGWGHGWLMGWRDICRATDERTVIASVVPRVGVGHTMPLFMTTKEPRQVAALLGNFCAIVLDFVARVKVGGTHMTYGYLKQLPVIPCSSYTTTDIAFIVPRVLELTYSAHDLSSWAQDLGYSGSPFAFNPERRAILRSELDAYYARLYGLTRDELRYILDPADVLGEDYPSETFRVLKRKELKEFGEYRTRNLVLREFDRMRLSEANGDAYVSLLSPPPGQQTQPTYSEQGIFRDEKDARLAGLLLTLIRQAGQLPHLQFNRALTLASHPTLLTSFVGAEDAQIVMDYQRRFPSIFEPARMEGDRRQTLLRHFETIGLIRIESKTGQLLAIDDQAIPSHVLIDDETLRVAAVLLQAVALAATSLAIDEVPATDFSAKQA